MDRKQAVKTILNPTQNGARLEQELHVLVSRADLEKEHSLLLARIHLLRRQLGYEPLLTGKQQRKEAHK